MVHNRRMLRNCRSGKANWLIVAGTIGLVLIVAILAFAKESPQAAANRFMYALAKGDVKQLAALSYMDGESPKDIEEAWDFSVNKAAPYYRFIFKYESFVQSDPNNASVKYMVVGSADSPSSYEEKREVPMVLKDGKWLVDVRGMDRRMFPALPR